MSLFDCRDGQVQRNHREARLVPPLAQCERLFKGGPVVEWFKQAESHCGLTGVTHSELHFVLVQEGPRGSLRAPEEHSGLFAVHPERHVAANIKRSSVSFRAANAAVIYFIFFAPSLPDGRALWDVDDVELGLVARVLPWRQAAPEGRAGLHLDGQEALL